jgi:hypothetical protein
LLLRLPTLRLHLLSLPWVTIAETVDGNEPPAIQRDRVTINESCLEVVGVAIVALLLGVTLLDEGAASARTEHDARGAVFIPDAARHLIHVVFPHQHTPLHDVDF